MSGSQQLLLGTGVSAVAANYIEDVFSTYLYTGNGTSQTITTGIDLSTKGGLLWIKNRNTLTYNHILSDTTQPVSKFLYSNSTSALDTDSSYITARGTSGFTVGSGNPTNYSGLNFVSWTFRKQAKFFDVVTWTGNGTARTIAHNLGSVPGCIIVKGTSYGSDWAVYHRGLATNQWIKLSETGAALTNNNIWQNTAPTSTVFSIGGEGLEVNNNGQTYVAYLFAHNAGGFGLTGTDNVISCGSFTAGGVVSLGYEPQWVMTKKTNGTGYWDMVDTMRGFVAPPGTTTQYLDANTSNAEASWGGVYGPTATGFDTSTLPAGDYIYIAIRRGPMKTPTTGTSVFDPVLLVNGVTNLPPVNSTINAPDLAWSFARNAIYGYGSLPRDRLSSAGISFLDTSTTAAEVSYAGNTFGFTRLQKGIDGANAGSTFNQASPGTIYWMFGRAPGFFDVVCAPYFAGNVNHNLGVAPEFVIVKARNQVNSWYTWHSSFGVNASSEYVLLNSNIAKDTYTDLFKTMTSTQIGLGNITNGNGIYYCFASCPGVSKVGTYTGTGALQTINCGFTGGARFVLIKRTDSAGDWFVYDSTRGITSGNDPYLLINSATAEVTGTNYVDTTSVGFQVTAAAPAGLNANGGTYIFLAIA